MVVVQRRNTTEIPDYSFRQRQLRQRQFTQLTGSTTSLADRLHLSPAGLQVIPEYWCRSALNL